MKRFFRLLFSVFILSISFLISTVSVNAEELQSQGSIQKIESEKVVLISNNFTGGDIFAYQDEKSSNFSGNTPHLLSFNIKNNCLTKKQTGLSGIFIHNISTNTKEVHQIRAP